MVERVTDVDAPRAADGVGNVVAAAGGGSIGGVMVMVVVVVLPLEVDETEE